MRGLASEDLSSYLNLFKWVDILLAAVLPHSESSILKLALMLVIIPFEITYEAVQNAKFGGLIYVDPTFYNELV